MKLNFCQQVVKGWLPRLKHIAKLTEETGNEHGFLLYPRGLRAKTCEGDFIGLDFPSEQTLKGCRPFAQVHTHPVFAEEDIELLHLPTGGKISRGHIGDIGDVILHRHNFGCVLVVKKEPSILFCYPPTSKMLRLANRNDGVFDSVLSSRIEKAMLKAGSCKLDLRKLK